MKKIIAFLISLFMVTTLMTACGSQEQKAGTEKTTSLETSTTAPIATVAPEKQQAQDTAVASIFPLKVKDANGIEVTISKKPTKIIPLSLGSAEILFSIVDKSRISAISEFADDAGVSNIADQAKEVKERASSSNAEKIIALQPDLVLLDLWTDAKFVKQLRDAKITVYVYKTAANIDDQEKVIQELAHLVGEDAKGNEVIDWMDSKLQAVTEKLKALKPEQKLSILDYSEMGSTSGKGTNFDDIVTRAGLINLAAKEGLEGWPQLSKEMIVKYNPDILSIPGWFYDTKINGKSFTDKIVNDKSLAGVKAVKNGKIIAITYKHLAAVSQYSVLGVEDTAKAAYPELFK